MLWAEHILKQKQFLLEVPSGARLFPLSDVSPGPERGRHAPTLIFGFPKDCGVALDLLFLEQLGDVLAHIHTLLAAQQRARLARDIPEKTSGSGRVLPMALPFPEAEGPRVPKRSDLRSRRRRRHGRHRLTANRWANRSVAFFNDYEWAWENQNWTHKKIFEHCNMLEDMQERCRLPLDPLAGRRRS